MIPSDIEIAPLSGSGDSSVSMTMEEYTGRVAKPTREVWVYDTDNSASDMVEVDQYPKAEFIGLNDPLTFSVVALGGSITVTGTSNSSVLKPIEYAEGLSFELSINGEVQSSWSSDNPAITGDIGADEEYSFSLKVTVPENQSTSQKSWTFQLSNGSQITTATITINQAAGVKTYSDITVSEFSYPVAPAGGGTLTPTLSYSQTWGWNGRETGGGTITSGAGLHYEITAGWDQGLIDTASGVVSAPSLGTQISIEQGKCLVALELTLNGKTAEVEYEVIQEENLPESVNVYPSFNYPAGSIPASGGTKSPITTGNIRITWSSGETALADETGASGYSVARDTSYEMTAASGFSIDSSTGVITAENRGTTVGDARSCGDVKRTLTITVTIDSKYGGGSISGTGTYTLTSPVTQEANVQTYSSVSIDKNTNADPSWYSGDWDNVPANTTFLPIIGYKHYTYTSGSTSQERIIDTGSAPPSNVIVNISQTWAIQSSTSFYKCSIAVSSRGTTVGEARTATVSWTVDGLTSNSISFTQVANVQTETGIRIVAYQPDNTWVAVDDWDSVPARQSYLNIIGYHQYSYTSGATNEVIIGDSEKSSIVNTTVDWAKPYGNYGNIYVENRGTSVGPARSGEVYWLLNGFKSNHLSFTQIANVQTQTGVRLVVDSGGIQGVIPASGGRVTFAPYRQYSYTSGATSETGYDTLPLECSADWIHDINNSNVNVDSRGTVAGAERSATVVAIDGNFRSNELTVTQEHNIVENLFITGIYFLYESASFDASGGVESVLDDTVVYEFLYTSGSSTDSIPSSSYGTFTETKSFSSSETWAAVNSSSGALTVASRGTVIGNSRSAIITESIQALWTPNTGFGQQVNKSSSENITIVQARNVPVSGSVTANRFTYSNPTISPAGGSTTPSTSDTFTITWSSGATSSPAQSTDDVQFAAVNSYSMALTTGFSIFSNTGTVTAISMGAQLGSRSCGDVARTLYFTITISDTYGGGSFNTSSLKTTLTAPVTQGVNSLVYDVPVITLDTPSDIPASGGTVSSVSILSVVQPYHYTSGSTGTVTSPARSNESWTPVTAASKGTTVSGRTLAGQLGYSCVCNGVRGTASVDVYQAQNRVTNTEWTSASCTVSPSSASVVYGGATVTVTKRASKIGVETYSSGSTNNVTYSAAVWSSSVSYNTGSGWISQVDTQNDRIIVSANSEVSSRTAVVTFTASLNGMTASDTITVTQDAHPVELYFDETSIPTVPEQGGEVFLTVHSNVQWGFYTSGVGAAATGIRDAGSTGTFATLRDDDSATPNAPGDYEIRLYYGSNSRTESVELYVNIFSLSPASSSMISGIQQAASSYLEVTPLSLNYEQSGGTLTIQITSNTSWTIDGNWGGGSTDKVYIVNPDDCIGCGACVSEGIESCCPASVIFSTDSGLLTISGNLNSCIECGACQNILNDSCPGSVKIAFN